jgi:hypothetical protein
MDKRQATYELLSQVRELYADKPILKRVFAAVGCKRLSEVVNEDLDALSALAQHYIQKATKAIASHAYVERIIDIKLERSYRNAESDEAIRDIYREIEAQETAGISLAEIKAVVDITLESIKRRDAAVDKEIDTIIREKIYGDV